MYVSMDTLQINKLCVNRYGNFLGCLPIDHLKDENIIKQLCHDLSRGKFVIFNIDEESEPGRHWILLARLAGGNLLMFDSFGAFGSNSVFKFMKNFGDVEKSMIPSQDDSLDGQLFQYIDDFNYKNDFTYQFNRSSILKVCKEKFKTYKNFSNMSTPLYYLLEFLSVLCPTKSIHNVLYFISQLQPINSIICGELCVLIAEILYRDFKVHLNKKPDDSVVKRLSDRIHDLFSTAYNDKIFVDLVKKYMLNIDPLYKVKAENLEYFQNIFSDQNTKLVV